MILAIRASHKTSRFTTPTPSAWQAERVFKPLRDVAEVKAEFFGVMPFPALNSLFDDAVPKGMQHYWKADFITELTDDAIAAHIEHGAKTPHVSSSMHLQTVRRSVSAPARRPLGTGTRISRRSLLGSGKTWPTTRPTSSG